jgi:SAM-dependent methyltransferase
MTGRAQPDFDRVARIYRWAEYLALGRLLERAREHYLPRLADRGSALVLGDGDGRFLARLLHQNSNLQALAVDTSAAMLGLLGQRCAFAADRLQTRQQSALEAAPAPETDLIVTHFFLDCLAQPEVDALVAGLAAKVRPGTLWVVSDFAVPAKPVLGRLAAVYVRALYLAFGLLTGLRVRRLPDPQSALNAAGFERLARKERLGGVLYTELWRRR